MNATITRYTPSPENFQIDALQGAYIVEADGSVRVARTIGGNSSRSGRTSWPKLIERGWIPGFRVDQIPDPGHELLEGKGEFVVFPVSETGHSTYGAYAVRVTDYTVMHNAWQYFRNPEDAQHGIYSFVDQAKEKYGISDTVVRLARNATRQWPGSNPTGVTWQVREAQDLVEYHGAWAVEDQEGRMLVYCPDRAVVVSCPTGFQFPDSACTAFGLCNVSVEGDNGQSVEELFLHPDESAGWAETLHIKVRGGDDWELFPVEELLLRTGSPFPKWDDWPQWTPSPRSEPVVTSESEDDSEDY